VEGGAREALDAGQCRHVGNVQRADARDQEARDVLGAAPGAHVPALLALVPARTRDLDSEVDRAAQVVVVGDPAQVRPDLVLRGERPAPVGVLLERERVHVRLDVAGTPGIGVVAPGTADVVGLLQHHEVVATGSAQRDGHAEAGEPGTDDDHAGLDHAPSCYSESTLPSVDYFR
jgi:hypothetical protein